ncbi:MAG: hypothetical protein ACOC88_03910 [Candidatus Bipolaricaulota bacterium]
MAKTCVYCNERPGKRECPALGGLICPICCGESRGVEIKCPTDCRYFQRGEEFQQEKRSEPYREAWFEKNSEVLEGENHRLLNALALVESLVYLYYEEDQLLTDDRLITGLSELEKRFKPIEVPTKNLELTEFVDDALVKAIEAGRLTEEQIREALSRTIEVARDFSDGSRGLVQGLTGRVKEDYNLPDKHIMDEGQRGESLITTPDQLNR